MESNLPLAPATERNRKPILAVLRERFAGRKRVLELGSGTGQHAVYFAQAMSWLSWHTSDLPENHAGIRAWIAHAGARNVLAPLTLDIAGEWPDARFDAVFAANVLHIASWPEVRALFQRLPRVLDDSATVIFYGPFNVGGAYTSESNASFDQWLKAEDPRRGIRDLEAVRQLAENAGLRFEADIPMPANNRCLVFEKP